MLINSFSMERQSTINETTDYFHYYPIYLVQNNGFCYFIFKSVSYALTRFLFLILYSSCDYTSSYQISLLVFMCYTLNRDYKSVPIIVSSVPHLFFHPQTEGCSDCFYFLTYQRLCDHGRTDATFKDLFAVFEHTLLSYIKNENLSFSIICMSW